MTAHTTTGRTRRLLAALAVLALAATGCGAVPNPLADSGYTVRARFAQSYNLFPGSPVRIQGVGVGSVADVDVNRGETAVTATLRLQEGVELPADVRAVIVPEALLGERYVQFQPGYDGTGPTLEPGATIPLSRTDVPLQFDQVLEGLNQFASGIDEQSAAELTSNLAEVLDGQGQELGQTIDQAAQAVSVLKNNDQQLVDLASRLADLNETLSTRDQQIGRVIEQFNTVTDSLADDRQQIDAAVDSILRLTRTLGDLVIDHHDHLQQDVAALTRVGRTLRRNLDNVSLAILSSAELFRHADRVVNRERNWLPLVNHIDAPSFTQIITESLQRRLVGECRRLGLGEDVCSQIPLEEVVGAGGLCLPGVIPCTTDEESGQQAVPLPQALRQTLQQTPELQQALRAEQRRREQQASGSSGDGPGPQPTGGPTDGPSPTPGDTPTPSPTGTTPSSGMSDPLLDSILGGSGSDTGTGS